jgi:hypothetical protein
VAPNLTWLSEIISTLRLRHKPLTLYLDLHYGTARTDSLPSDSLHYEAAWTDSWSHRRCRHQHQTLIEAAKCAMPNGAGWYVFAVDARGPRQLTDAEDAIVNEFRFGSQDLR